MFFLRRQKALVIFLNIHHGQSRISAVIATAFEARLLISAGRST